MTKKKDRSESLPLVKDLKRDLTPNVGETMNVE